MFPRVTAARHVREYVLELTFADGERGEVDFTDMFVGSEGLPGEPEDPEMFRGFRVDDEAGTVVWPNGVDVCPVLLYSKVTGRPLPEPARQASGR
jgi:hypothetical protein